MEDPHYATDAELLADLHIVVEYGHSTAVEFFCRRTLGGRNVLLREEHMFLILKTSQQILMLGMFWRLALTLQTLHNVCFRNAL